MFVNQFNSFFLHSVHDYGGECWDDEPAGSGNSGYNPEIKCQKLNYVRAVPANLPK